MPKGWFGIAPVIKAFLAHKEDQFAIEHSVSSGAAIVGGSLQAITTAIAKSGSAALRWSEAQSAIDAAKPQARDKNVLQWLVNAELLIEDGPSTDAIGAENVVRPAFERFGDFLIASAILESIPNSNFHQAFRSGGQFSHLFSTAEAVRENPGVISALSVLLPEKESGLELSDLVDGASLREAVAVIVVRAIPWRSADTFYSSTQKLLRDMLITSYAYNAMNAMLAVSTLKSQIDALWLHEVMGSLPFAERDAFWSRYLLVSYGENEIVRRMIEAANDIDVQKVDEVTAERWCLALMWFSAAPDRRVKDFATRAVLTILHDHLKLLPNLVRLFLSTDDDEVLERVLLVAYGALIRSRDEAVLKELAEELLTAYAHYPEYFQNAIIRDHIRCIAELAEHIGCLNTDLDPTLPDQRNPEIPQPASAGESDEQAWRNEPNPGARIVVRSCLHGDFNHYSINCLSGWNYAMPKQDVGRWIAKRILADFGYRDSHCGVYDYYLTRDTGGGREKPAWSERIGKKYQWIAMYQLASRLYDSLDRKTDEPTTGRLALILSDQRKMDPTISRPKRPERTPSECWWVSGTIDLQSTKHFDYRAWVNCRDDLPTMESLLVLKNRDGQNWLPLICYPTWSEHREGRPYGEPYRASWLQLKSYLVPEAQAGSAMKATSRRNFFGRWTPNGAKWLDVFVGEYPWASSCNIETDEWRGFTTKVGDSGLEFIPVSNEVVCEWEYDSTMATSIYFHVPARAFFKAGPLWWNGVDGFSKPDGKTAFRDPSASEGGAASLVADIDDLLPRLETMGYRLFWTLIGEKYILGDEDRDTPRMRYSQTAWLGTTGAVTIGERVFLDDYNTDQGLAK